MSIKTTLSMSRQLAIARIRRIGVCVLEKRYRDIQNITFEPDEDVKEFVDGGLDFSLANLEQWSDRMLEDKMDEPFFRLSMFDNYRIEEPTTPRDADREPSSPRSPLPPIDDPEQVA